MSDDRFCPSDSCLRCPARCHRKTPDPVPAEEALQRLFRGASFALGEEEIPLPTALGRVTARDTFAAISMPATAGSQHDGVAVSHDAVAEKLRRGEPLLEPGEYLLRGMHQVVEPPYDTVIPAEKLRFHGDQVEVLSLPGRGGGVLGAGSNFRKGDRMVPAGFRLTPASLAILRYAGVETVPVRKKPRAVILPTGADALPPGSRPGPGQFIEANSLLVRCMVEQLGGTASVLPTAADDPDEVCRAVAAAEYDILFLIGGAGRGGARYGDCAVQAVKRVGHLLVQGTDIGPGGKPHFFAEIGGRPVVGVPGPLHASVTQAERFLRPIMERFLQVPCDERLTVWPELSDEFTRPIRPGYRPHVRVEWHGDGRLTVHPIRMGDTSDCFVRANAVLAAERDSTPGEPVRCILTCDPGTARRLGEEKVSF